MEVIERAVRTLGETTTESLQFLVVVAAQLTVCLLSVAAGAAVGGAFSRGAVGLSVGFVVGIVASVVTSRWLTKHLERSKQPS